MRGIVFWIGTKNGYTAIIYICAWYRLLNWHQELQPYAYNIISPYRRLKNTSASSQEGSEIAIRWRNGPFTAARVQGLEAYKTCVRKRGRVLFFFFLCIPAELSVRKKWIVKVSASSNIQNNPIQLHYILIIRCKLRFLPIAICIRDARSSYHTDPQTCLWRPLIYPTQKADLRLNI